MYKHFLTEYKHIHFIGIGGSGMYPLVQILHGLGAFVTGSDNNETDTVKSLKNLGISVFLQQKAENIRGADLIVYTVAISEDNEELKAARQSGVKMYERSELLGMITELYSNAICVSGTHGKTTVSSMITQVLYNQGLDVSAVIGGKLPVIGGSGRFGESDIMVCEACEFKDHFLNLKPDICVILNIDEDHLDYFKTLENIIASFHKFARNATKAVIVNGDCPNSMKAVENLPPNIEIITFGKSHDNDYYYDFFESNGFSSEFYLYYRDYRLSVVTLNVIGEHNALNATAAAAAAFYVGVKVDGVEEGLKAFKGAARRFDKYGEVKGVTVVDDYAHHPAEIAVTLNAAKNLGYKRVWAVHQPFTFTRTAALLDDFAQALQIADKVVLTAIMGGRETNESGIKSADLGVKIPDCVYYENNGNEYGHDESFQLVCDYVCENAQDGDLVITLGCGDVNKLAKMILEKL